MIEITLKDIKDMMDKGATINVVKTPLQMLEESRIAQEQSIRAKAIEEAEAKRKQIMSMTEEEVYQDIQTQKMPVTETIRAFKNVILKSHPNASVLLLGTEMELNKSSWVEYDLEILGRSDTPIISTICESIKNSPRFRNIFNGVIDAIGATFEGKAAEIAISEFQQIINKLKKRNETHNLLALKNAELDRLRKQGKKELVEIKLKEIQEIKQKAERRRIAREKNLASLAKARQVRAEKRAEEKKRKQQQQHQQPNFAKMAKQKRQQIAARQAEKKKKKSTGSGTSDTKSCSQLLSK